MATAVDAINIGDSSPPPAPSTASGSNSPVQSLATPLGASGDSNSTASSTDGPSVNRRLTRKSSLTKDFEARRRIRRDSRVRFREGEELTDSCPAKTPWKDVVPPSRGRILEMYRAACTKVKVRPLNQVIDFVQGIEDFTIRQEALSLKGVRLEPRHCEALEEVFRRVSVNILNLEGCGLEDDGALALLEMVEFYEAAFCLILSNNPKIQRSTWLALSRMMKRATFLHYIDLAQTTTDIHSLPLLGRSLRANCPLVTLHLERNSLSGPRLVILAAALKTNTNLAHIYLGENGLTAEDAVMLGAMLKGNRRLELLDIRDNHLLDQGIVLLCQALSCQEQGLKALVLWNNRFTTKSVPAMATMLALHRTLHTLEVGRNRLGNDGMESLKLGLMRNRSIVRLGLMELGLTTTGTIALAEYIGESPVLETVNVRRNNIRLAGLLALARAHKLSQSLIRLDVDTSIKCDQQDQELLQDLIASLQEYSFRNRQLADEKQMKASQEEARQQREGEQKAEEAAEEEAKGASPDNDDVFDDSTPESSSERDTSASTETANGSEALSNTANDVEAAAGGDHITADAAAADLEDSLEASTTSQQASEAWLAGSAGDRAAEGLLLKASHHHSITEEDEEEDLGADDENDASRETDGQAMPRNALTSPQAEESVMSFDSEVEAALEELEPEKVDMIASEPVNDIEGTTSSVNTSNEDASIMENEVTSSAARPNDNGSSHTAEDHAEESGILSAEAEEHSDHPLKESPVEDSPAAEGQEQKSNADPCESVESNA